jgi:nitroreductase
LDLGIFKKIIWLDYVLDFFELIKFRRSIRNFTLEDISDKEVKMILEAGRWAPSAGNVQPWKFIIIRKVETKKKLANAALHQSFIEKAPVVIVVCADENKSRRAYGSRGINLYCIQDTAAAIQNILLTVCILGLGACWVGAFREDMLKTVLNLPKGLKPVAIIPIGHPIGDQPSKNKHPLEKIIHYEIF